MATEPSFSAPAHRGTLPESREIEIVTDLGGLRRLRAEWNDAAPPKATEPWQSFAWAEASATAYSHSHALRVVTMKKNGRLTAIAPLVLKPSSQPLRPWRLDFLGGEELKEPNRFISLDPGALDLILDTIASERTFPVRLSRVPNDGRIAHLVAKFRRAGWITKTLSMPYPYLDLTADPIRKTLREDLRRARRRGERRGGVKSHQAVVQGKEQLRDHLLRAFRIEASGWKGRNRTAILSNPARREFFERYACSALEDGTLRLFFLTVGGEDVAVQYGIESAGSYWLLNIGYDERYRECSPGHLLLEETVRSAARDGLTRYNFLGKSEPWISRWTSQTQDCVVLAAYRPNLHGFRAVLSDTLYLARQGQKYRRLIRAKVLRAASSTE